MADESGGRVPDLASILRDAIRADGRSLRQIGLISGLDGGRLSRFMSGDRDINLNGAGRLFDVVGIKVIVPAAKPKTAKRKAKSGRPKRKKK